jgi:hypothetical protein
MVARVKQTQLQRRLNQIRFSRMSWAGDKTGVLLMIYQVYRLITPHSSTSLSRMRCAGKALGSLQSFVMLCISVSERIRWAGNSTEYAPPQSKVWHYTDEAGQIEHQYQLDWRTTKLFQHHR